ncbi:hypothetical protein [Clostridium gasigenes]|uniref:DUF4868 domain-containing protein n=1 Tax=Clostridium gasigenes TaxID=94869 RepID=A0A1H0VM31_9CLOT|nr:hypothetical protein [Clostridium gasigenes]MBU3106966.1 hypothetical protein [Clostridium gasigenes]SDP79341.1 hypothetical protein SAMN04488529_11771 [Clostridium gasigenes]
MDNTTVFNLLNPYIKAITDDEVSSASMYAFKTTPLKSNLNQHLNLDYEFFDTNMPHEKVKSTIKTILEIFENKFLNDNTTTFEKYSIHNAKKIIDFINLDYLNFNDPLLLNATATIADVDNYKIQYFLHRLDTNCQVAYGNSSYSKFKHSLLQLTTSDDKTITIINKVAPIYKPKGFLFLMNTDLDSEASTFDLIEKDLFRLPLYPHIIIVDNICFLIEANVESIFGFEKYNKQLRDDCLNDIKSKLTITPSSLDLIKSFSRKGRNFNIFATLNSERFDNIVTKDVSTKNLLSNKLSLSYDQHDNLDITSLDDAKKLILYLCDSLLQDLDDSTLYESKNNKPLI